MTFVTRTLDDKKQSKCCENVFAASDLDIHERSWTTLFLLFPWQNRIKWYSVPANNIKDFCAQNFEVERYRKHYKSSLQTSLFSTMYLFQQLYLQTMQLFYAVVSKFLLSHIICPKLAMETGALSFLLTVEYQRFSGFFPIFPGFCSGYCSIVCTVARFFVEFLQTVLN